jgi:hypothetical protein
MPTISCPTPAPSLDVADLADPAESGVRWTEPTRGVRVLEARRDGAFVVEVRASRAENPLHKAHRALSAIGVSVVHTEVRPGPDTFVQKLHLLEPDESSLSRSRLLAALRAIATACQTTVAARRFSFAWNRDKTPPAS